MSSTKAPTTPVAVFDISSASVGGAHALVKKSDETSRESVVVLAQSRIDAPLQQDLTIERFIAQTARSIEMVATEIRKADTHQPEYIQIVLASPWYSSQTRIITYSKTTSFQCTNRLINDLIDKEIAYILKNETGELGSIGKDFIIVEKQLSLIKLNGYVTNVPYGKKATSIELYLTVTVAPKLVVTQFTDMIRRIYGTRKIGVTTSAYTTFVALRDSAQSARECVIVDIGEEVTDVAFVKDQLFLYQHSFPVGTYELYRGLAEHSSHNLEETQTILEASLLQKLTTQAKSTSDNALILFSSTWQKALQDIIDHGQYGFALPSQWYVTVHPRFETIIKDAIKKDPYIIHRASAVVDVQVVTPETLNKVKPLVDTVLDVPLAAGLLFIERLV